MKTHKITITQKHLDECFWGDVDFNPVSLAIADVFGKPCFLRTGRQTLALLLHGTVIPLPKHVEDLFDLHLNGDLTPRTFELEVPEDWESVEKD